MRRTSRCLLVLGFALLACLGRAREFTVVAYNVENLFDVDGVSAFEEYAAPGYGPAQLQTKLDGIAAVLRRIDATFGADVVLLNEIETDRTPAATPPDYAALLRHYAGTTVATLLARPDDAVRDLPAEFLLLKRLEEAGLHGYTLVTADEPSAAATTQKNAILTRLPVKAVRNHPTPGARRILEVELSVDGAALHVFCNHWKSGASDPQTEKTRIENARTLRARLDEILRADPHADIILGGDFNSQYDQRQRYRGKMPVTGLNDILRSQGNELAIRGADRDLYNLWYELPAAQRGSDLYRDEWGTLIHLIIARGLYDFRGVQYVDNSFAVARFAGLNMDDAGRPIRWSGAGRGSGFSDHFPVVARFRTVKENNPARWLSLRGKSGAEKPEGEPAPRLNYAGLKVARIAQRLDRLPAGADLQDGSWNQRLFLVEGTVESERPLRITCRGQSFEIYAPDPALRRQLEQDHPVGSKLRLYGELGQYRGRWQFVVHDAAWLKVRP